MSEDNKVICQNCNQEMIPVELHEVPIDNIKDFLDVTGNKLEDNWHWCSGCETYDQWITPKRLSPEAENFRRLLEDYSSFF